MSERDRGREAPTREAAADRARRMCLARMILGLLAPGPPLSALGAIADTPVLAHAGAAVAGVALQGSLPLVVAFVALEVRATRGASETTRGASDDQRRA